MKTQPSTADIQAQLDSNKTRTRKLHSEMQAILESRNERTADQRFAVANAGQNRASDYTVKCKRCGSNVWATRIEHHLTWCLSGCWAKSWESSEKEIDYEAHADALAEALRDCLPYVSHDLALTSAIETHLANYEASSPRRVSDKQ